MAREVSRIAELADIGLIGSVLRIIRLRSKFGGLILNRVTGRQLTSIVISLLRRAAWREDHVCETRRQFN
jgi:hypothetical protein